MAKKKKSGNKPSSQHSRPSNASSHLQDSPELVDLSAIGQACPALPTNLTCATMLVLGGDGQHAVALARQLNPASGHVTHLATTECRTAQRRASAEGLSHITWQIGSLQQLGETGPFDYILCTNTLQYQDNPAAALTTLAGHLKASAVIGLALPGRYGLSGLRQIHDLLTPLWADEASASRRSRLTQTLLDHLPGDNWLQHNKTALLPDDLNALVLTPTLHTFRVPDLYSLAQAAGLRLARFASPAQRDALLPASGITDPALLAAAEALPVADQQAVMEIFYGNMAQHSCFLSTAPEARS